MAMTTFSSEQIMKMLFTDESLTRPTEWFVSLHTGNPNMVGDNEPGTGLFTGDYERQQVTFTVTQEGDYWEAVNDEDVVFPAADDSVTIEYVGVFDQQGDEGEGNMLAQLELPIARQLQEGSVFTVPAGELKIIGGVE